MSDPVVSGEPPRSPETPSATPAPEVSVLVRSMGRASLAEALASVAQQTFSDLEVVVVAASGRPHPPLPALAGRFPIRLIEPGWPLSRPAAANAALRAARGRWLIFLDDDDLFDADHVERLHAALQADPAARAAYAGVRLIDADGHAAGEIDEDFDAARLWLANYLPIHAVMFSRRVLEAGCRFDESFEVYEDWDFWQQVACRGPLLHVPGVSATYRMLGDSGLTASADRDQSRARRLKFYLKWLPRLEPAAAETLAAGAEQRRAELAAVQIERAEERRLALQAIEQVNDRADRAEQRAARADRDRLAAERARLAADRDRLATEQAAHQAASESAARLAHVQADLAASLAAYGRLEQGYRAIVGSLSWRITAPLRWLRQRLAAHTLARSLWRALPLEERTRLRLRSAIAGHRWTRPLVQRWSPQVLTAPAAHAAPAEALDKEAVRAEAEAALGRFLEGSDRIALACGDAAPEVSVIVVMFNQAGLTRLCLQALAASRGVTFETLLVDNGSTDRICLLLERVDGASVLRPGENLGFLRAVNRAARQARGRLLLLLNNDALVEPDTLAHAAARLNRDPGAAAVGGPILLWDGRLQEAGSIIWRDGSCLGYGRGDDPQRPPYRYVRDVDYCSGAFLMVRRELFDRLSGFDEVYAPAYYEESDFCARLWERGHRVVYDPAVRVRHFEFASEGESGKAIALQQRNRALFVERRQAFLRSQCEAGTADVLRARQRVAEGCLRVLVIDDRVPLPWLGQGYPRAAAIVALLAGAGHAVTLYPLQFPNEQPGDVARAVAETVEVLLGLGPAGLPQLLRERRGLYDAVIVSRPHNMQALREAMAAEPAAMRGTRIVYDAEAMFSLREIAKAALEGRSLSAAEQRRRVAAELALAEGADAILAVSAAEAAHYRAGGHAQVLVLGHAIEAVADTPAFEARRGFVFVGALMADDTPNSDSVLWFVREVWPLVLQALGPQLLHIVGACEAPRVRALQGPTVVIHGRVDDLAGMLDAARVCVVPTRYAAGIPHKAHEAAARGLPMVVTPLIADQLGWRDRVGVGEDAASFAAQCVALHQNAARWQHMREGLIEAVRRDCSPLAFEAALQSALGIAARSA